MKIVVEQASNPNGSLDSYEKDKLQEFNLEKHEFENGCTYTIELDSIEDLFKLRKPLGRLIIDSVYFLGELHPKIMIYDANIE